MHHLFDLRAKLIGALYEGGAVVWFRERMEDTAASVDSDGARSLGGFQYEFPSIARVTADEEHGCFLICFLSVCLKESWSDADELQEGVVVSV